MSASSAAARSVAPYDQIRLEDVAADAAATVQTVLRRFGSKSGVMGAVVRRELGVIAAARAAADTGRPRHTIAELVVHYERYGALILKTCSEAPYIDGLVELAGAGRAHHLNWCLPGRVRRASGPRSRPGDADAQARAAP